MNRPVESMPPPSAGPPPSGEGPPPPRRSVPIGWVILVVAGALLSLMALVPLAGGGFLVWANATQRDADGFYTTSHERFETTSYAITSQEIDLGTDPDPFDLDAGDLATVRFDVTGAGEEPIFIGIAPEDDAAQYLEGVGRAEVDDVTFGPFAVDYDFIEGGAPPGLPGDEVIWVASSEGAGDQTLEWELESGRWTVVVMNADGSPGVSADIGLGAKASWVLPLGIGLLVGGGLGLLVGAVMLVVGVIGLARGTYIDLTGPAAAAGVPVQISARLDEPLSRWLWLVKWVLLIPHFIVLAVLWLAFSVVTLIAFFAILFTKRYPRSLFEFNVGVLRWTWRVAYYGYGALGTDRYPPFTLGHEPGYPAVLDVAYPQQLSRGLVLVKWWLLAIPQYLVVALIGFGLVLTPGSEVAWAFGGLLGLLVLFAGVALLFVGQYPRGLHDLVMGLNRWVYRVVVYAALLRDEYPPFRLDQGEDEPATPPSGDGRSPGAERRPPVEEPLVMP